MTDALGGGIRGSSRLSSAAELGSIRTRLSQLGTALKQPTAADINPQLVCSEVTQLCAALARTVENAVKTMSSSGGCARSTAVTIRQEYRASRDGYAASAYSCPFTTRVHATFPVRVLLVRTGRLPLSSTMICELDLFGRLWGVVGQSMSTPLSAPKSPPIPPPHRRGLSFGRLRATPTETEQLVHGVLTLRAASCVIMVAAR